MGFILKPLCQFVCLSHVHAQCASRSLLVRMRGDRLATRALQARLIEMNRPSDPSWPMGYPLHANDNRQRETVRRAVYCDSLRDLV